MDDDLTVLQGKLMRVASALTHFVPTSDHARQLRSDMRELLEALEKRRSHFGCNA